MMALKKFSRQIRVPLSHHHRFVEKFSEMFIVKNQHFFYVAHAR